MTEDGRLPRPHYGFKDCLNCGGAGEYFAGGIGRWFECFWCYMRRNPKPQKSTT